MARSFECGPEAHRKIQEIRSNANAFAALVRLIEGLKLGVIDGEASRGIRTHSGIILTNGTSFTFTIYWQVRGEKVTLLDIDLSDGGGPH